MDVEEYKQELIELLDYILEREGIPKDKINLKFKNVRRGRMHSNGLLSFPLGVLSKYRYNVHYTYYYLIHEISHYISMVKGTADGIHYHGNSFKQIEIFWMNEFGLVPEYKKAYVSKLFSKNGILLWKEPIW